MLALLDSHLGAVCKVFELDHLALCGLTGEVVIQRCKELGWFELKGADDDFHIGQGDVSFASLYAAHVAAVQAAVIRKALLRKALCLAKTPNRLAQSHKHRQSLGMNGGFVFHGALWLMQAL